MDNKKILETLQMQPLSEDEKTRRHIIGRLYGPIATCKESTRNGRKYNKQLWENALHDEVFNEKVSNKSLFLELGHPADREETDMRQACACIPELPKIVDDDLYAYVDILDTPNGRLLKTFIDYGFVPGISSRGSGDIMANDEVDPETFFLETWDIVQLPAVKKARLAVCESLDQNAIKLRKALTESYNGSSEEDKEVMKEALDNLNIKLDEAESIDWATVPVSELRWAADEDASLTEATDEEEVENTEVDEPVVEEQPSEETEADSVDEPVESDEEPKENVYTVGNLVDDIKDYDTELAVEYSPIIMGEQEIAINGLKFDDSIDGKLVINIDYVPAEEDNIDAEKVEEPEVKVDEISVNGEEAIEEPEIAVDEVIDDEADEVIESLKEMIRQKDELEEEVKSLKKDKTVSDAEVATLKEELNRYKDSFERTSELAAKSKDLEKEIETLTESVNQKDATIKDLQEKQDNTVKLNESMNDNARKVKTLTENLNALQKEFDAAESKHEEQEAQYKAKLTESINTAKKYKAKFNLVLNRYIESKASMLGVKSTDITSRLNESYTLDDIDKVCDDLLNYNVNMSSLPFMTNRTARVKVNESVNKPTEDDDLSDLLELAGLK